MAWYHSVDIRLFVSLSVDLSRMSPGHLPGEVYWACPTMRRTQRRPRTCWSGNILESSQKIWKRWLWKEKSGSPCSSSWDLASEQVEDVTTNHLSKCKYVCNSVTLKDCDTVWLTFSRIFNHCLLKNVHGDRIKKILKVFIPRFNNVLSLGQQFSNQDTVWDRTLLFSESTSGLWLRPWKICCILKYK